MSPDILEGERAEHRVADRVEEHIRVRVPFQTLRIGDLNAADDEPSPLSEAMRVKTDANSHTPPTTHNRLYRIG
jgi:hypothetical protein